MGQGEEPPALQSTATPCLGKEATPAKLPTLSTGAMNTETPVRMKTARPVSLCSLWVAAQVSRVPGIHGSPPPQLPSGPQGLCSLQFWWPQGKGSAVGRSPKPGQMDSMSVSMSLSRGPTAKGFPRAGECLLFT